MPSKPRNVDSTGLSELAATDRNASATTSPVVCNGGTNTTTTASTPASDTAAAIAVRNCSAEASTPTSCTRATCMPAAGSAFVTNTDSAVELLTTATRSPGGSGCV